MREAEHADLLCEPIRELALQELDDDCERPRRALFQALPRRARLGGKNESVKEVKEWASLVFHATLSFLELREASSLGAS